MHDFISFPLLHCRVHREGEQSARVERGPAYNRRSNQTGNEEDRSHHRSSGGWRHHSEKSAHRQALGSDPHDDQSSDQQQGELLPNFLSARHENVQTAMLSRHVSPMFESMDE